VLTAVLAVAFLDERMTWRKAIGLLLGLGGVAFVVESRMAGGVDHPIGVALLLAALVSLVAGSILYKSLRLQAALGRHGVQSLAAGLLRRCRSPSRSRTSETSCRAGVSLRRWPICAVRLDLRLSPLVHLLKCPAQLRQAPITS
jgi:hypothetical protein